MRVPDVPLDGSFTTIRSATPEDVDLLVAWHADPDVARYWDGKTFTREQMALQLARPDVDPYVVVHDGEPVGYLQVWSTWWVRWRDRRVVRARGAPSDPA